MMRLIKFLAYFLVLLALIIVFLPKINLFYAAEIMMKENKLFVSDEEVLDKGYALELRNAKLSYESLSLAEIDSITLSPWILYNALSLNNIHVNEGFSDFLPQEIQEIKIEHIIYDPTNITLRGDSEDSYIYGNIDLLEKVLVLHLRLGAKSEKKYKAMLGKLSKEEGGYVYEYKF